MVLVRLLADAEDTTKGGTLHKKLQQAIEDQGWDPGSMQKVEQKRIPHIQSMGCFFDFPIRKSWAGYKFHHGII